MIDYFEKNFGLSLLEKTKLFKKFQVFGKKKKSIFGATYTVRQNLLVGKKGGGEKPPSFPIWG